MGSYFTKSKYNMFRNQTVLHYQSSYAVPGGGVGNLVLFPDGSKKDSMAPLRFDGVVRLPALSSVVCPDKLPVELPRCKELPDALARNAGGNSLRVFSGDPVDSPICFQPTALTIDAMTCA